MNNYIIILPSKYNIPVDVVDIAAVVPPDEFPQVHVSIDGKPSDQYVSGRSYVTSCLFALSPNSFDYVHKRLTELYGAKLVKPALLRKKRRLKYLKTLVEHLITMKGEAAGLPINSMHSICDGAALDPQYALDYFLAHPIERGHCGIRDITSTHVIFVDGAKEELVPYAQFGGMVYWIKIAQEMDAYITKVNGKPICWMLHADKLPCDHDNLRMRIFSRLLDETFNGRAWVTYTRIDEATDDIPVDLLTDIYVSILYECKCTEGANDTELEEAWTRFMAITTTTAK